MTRKIVMGIIMAFALGVVGCRMCMSPYDYCQPTLVPERGDVCMGELYRCGSVLGGVNQHASPDGECKECNGGSVEYYSASGYAGAETSVAQTESYASPSYAQESPAYAGNYAPTPVGAYQTAGGEDFSLSEGAY